MSKREGILKVGLANLAAGIFAFIVLLIIAAIPLIGIVSPIISYLAYLYALKVVLDMTMLEAFLVSIVSSLVFFLVSVLVSIGLGIWFFKYVMVRPPIKPVIVYF